MPQREDEERGSLYLLERDAKNDARLNFFNNAISHTIFRAAEDCGVEPTFEEELKLISETKK